MIQKVSHCIPTGASARGHMYAMALPESLACLSLRSRLLMRTAEVGGIG